MCGGVFKQHSLSSHKILVHCQCAGVPTHTSSAHACAESSMSWAVRKPGTNLLFSSALSVQCTIEAVDGNRDARINTRLRVRCSTIGLFGASSSVQILDSPVAGWDAYRKCKPVTVSCSPGVLLRLYCLPLCHCVTLPLHIYVTMPLHVLVPWISAYLEQCLFPGQLWAFASILFRCSISTLRFDAPYRRSVLCSMSTLRFDTPYQRSV